MLEEYGDLMFVMANLARHLGLDPEAALRAANAKFTRRFGAIERRHRRSGQDHADGYRCEQLAPRRHLTPHKTASAG